MKEVRRAFEKTFGKSAREVRLSHQIKPEWSSFPNVFISAYIE